MTTLHPQVEWAENNTNVFINVNLFNTNNLNVDFEESLLKFHAESEGNTYEFSLDFPEKISLEKSKYSTDRIIRIILEKEEAKRWGKLINSNAKPHWIKCDWEKWVDEDEEDEIQEKGMDGFGDMNFSNFPGMGGMGGMGGMENIEEMMKNMGRDDGIDEDESAESDDLGTNEEDPTEDAEQDSNKKEVENADDKTEN